MEKAKEVKELIGFWAFVPAGEHTLDIRPVCAIDLLKKLSNDIALITNSLLSGS